MSNEQFENSKVTNIKYKQMDKCLKIKGNNEMERFVLGEKGVGLLDHFGLTPGKIQKYLDEGKEKELEELIKEHRDYIFWEFRKRSAEMVQYMIKENEELVNKYMGGSTTE
ncbi:hypothetical protein ACIGQ5_22650 [Peribacillus frigoritolerans]|uniref:hypothetical protein n=1 Tax=Peribacillus frigoritolerans TaxID=450367 RepID=UPI0037CB092D